MSHDTMESSRARAHRNYVRLKKQHQCVACTVKLPPAETFVRCLRCRNMQNGEGAAERTRMRLERFRSELARVVETAGTMSVREQAEALGLDVDRIYALRARARREGASFPMERGGAKEGVYTPESKKWAELEAKTERCRCGLLLPCESCIPEISAIATGRRGPGPTYPVGGP